jgi:two-component sensor histidine kinase
MTPTGNDDLLISSHADPALAYQAAVSVEAVLAAQKNSLELVVQGAPVEAVLTELARVVEETSKGVQAAIAIVDSRGRLRPPVAPSLPSGVGQAFETIGTTARTDRLEATWHTVLPLPETLGVRSAWVYPIVNKENRVLGGFGIFFRERTTPSGFEFRLVETLSQTAALAIVRHEAEADMARQRRTLDLAMEAADMGSWRYTFEDNICLYDERAARLYGLADGRYLHDEQGVKAMIHSDDQERMWAAVAAACEPSSGRYDVEYRVRRPDGSWRWLSAWGIVEFETSNDGSARPVAIAGSSRDITAAKLADEHQRLLVNELNHRVKNTLAIVQAITHQTLRHSGDVDEIRQAIDARIFSLARAHDLLTTANWSGADLVDVVRLATGPFSSEKFETAGPPLQVSPKQALAFSMALHELGTNAAKYGALASPTGRISVTWSVHRRTLVLTWREHGGRPVTTPARRGFGSRLLEGRIGSDLGGSAQLEYAPGGVIWQVQAAVTSPHD